MNYFIDCEIYMGCGDYESINVVGSSLEELATAYAERLTEITTTPEREALPSVDEYGQRRSLYEDEIGRLNILIKAAIGPAKERRKQAEEAAQRRKLDEAKAARIRHMQKDLEDIRGDLTPEAIAKREAAIAEAAK